MGAHRPVGRCRGSAADRDGSDRQRQGSEGRGARRLSPALAWRLCALAGLATLLASTGFGQIPNLVACGPTGGAGPILAFELVRSPADMIALFGSEPCTSRFAAAQRAGLWLDMLGFIPAYTAFLGLGAWALRGNGKRLAQIALAAVVAGGLLDEVEGLLMFGLLDGFPGDPALFGPLFWVVHAKFVLLAAGSILIAELLMRLPLLQRLFAGVIVAGGWLALWMILFDPRSPWMMLGHRIAWTTLLVIALSGAFRPHWWMRRDKAKPDA